MCINLYCVVFPFVTSFFLWFRVMLNERSIHDVLFYCWNWRHDTKNWNRSAVTMYKECVILSFCLHCVLWNRKSDYIVIFCLGFFCVFQITYYTFLIFTNSFYSLLVLLFFVCQRLKCVEEKYFSQKYKVFINQSMSFQVWKNKFRKSINIHKTLQIPTSYNILTQMKWKCWF